jgi:predicted flap endonuclease-1-like 5' DNA nuclease
LTYPISKIEGIGPDVASSLRSVGIRTTTKLLEAAKSPKGRLALKATIGVDEKRILAWANMADRMRIKGVGEEYAELLRVVGVDTVRELKYRNPARLAKTMAEANRKRKLVRLLPSAHTVERWIETARKLPPKITY